MNIEFNKIVSLLSGAATVVVAAANQAIIPLIGQHAFDIIVAAGVLLTALSKALLAEETPTTTATS